LNSLPKIFAALEISCFLAPCLQYAYLEHFAFENALQAMRRHGLSLALA
jgi:hypothetical protein